MSILHGNVRIGRAPAKGILHRVWSHGSLKLNHSERLFVNVTFKKQLIRFYKRLIVNPLSAIMHLKSLKCHELFFAGSQIEFETKQLPEHQIEDIHHAPCDFRNAEKYQTAWLAFSL